MDGKFLPDCTRSGLKPGPKAKSASGPNLGEEMDEEADKSSSSSDSSSDSDSSGEEIKDPDGRRKKRLTANSNGEPQVQHRRYRTLHLMRHSNLTKNALRKEI